ncbi:MAG: GAF domain-containing protein [Verrucomicrobiales bacterium]|nr:GAF domain-containing protein [Verrucomicrobiales bacterium]
MSVVHTQLLRLSGLGDSAPEVERQLETWIDSSSPAQLISLIDAGALGLLKDAFTQAGGCEGTVWLIDHQSRELVACYNSGEEADRLVGFRQPVGQGIISMVFAQQQPYCENHIEASAGHDDTLDRKIAKHTTAMIAVPFYFAFGLRGVISCVQLAEAPQSREGFRSADVETLARAANLVERLINGTLLTSLLGLGDGG